MPQANAVIGPIGQLAPTDPAPSLVATPGEAARFSYNQLLRRAAVGMIQSGRAPYMQGTNGQMAQLNDPDVLAQHLGQYGYSASQLMAFADPNASSPPAAAPAKKKK